MSSSYGEGNGRALTLTALAESKRLPVAFLREIGLSDLPSGGVSILYLGMTGEEIAVKRRTALKATNGSYWPKGQPLAAYGQWRLDRAQKAGFLILVEGESDCWALWHQGVPALGIPGATATKTLSREHLDGICKVYIHREPDAGGRSFLENAKRRLRDLEFEGLAFDLRMPEGIKDLADLHAADPAAFHAKLEAAILAACPVTFRPGDAYEDPRDQAGQVKDSAATSPPRPPEPYEPFPVDALPSPIAEYVRQGALALGCDPAYLALPALAVAAGLIGFTRLLRLKRTWRVPSVLWTLVVADSGSLKTPAFRHATDFLFAFQKRLDLEYQRRLAEFLEAKEKWEAAAKAAKQANGTPPDDKPEEPVRPTLFTSDATIEAVAELIGENPRGLLVSCDELAGWLGSFGRYKGKAGGTDLPRWLSMYSAGGFAYHRKTGDRRRIVVPHAAVSVAGGIQPGILAAALEGEFTEAGGAGRLLMAMPPRPAKVWTETEIDPDTERRYQELLEALYRLGFDGADPHVLRLSPEAKAVWVHWYNTWSKEQAAVEGALAAAFSKLEEIPARLALIHHVATRLDRGESDLGQVEAESVEAGVVLARWFARESRRVYAALAGDGERRATRQLAEWVQARGGRVTARDLQRSNGKKYPTASAAEAGLEALVQAGLGVWLEPEDGARTMVFELRPTVRLSDTTADGATGPMAAASDSVTTGGAQSTLLPAISEGVSDVSDCRTGLLEPQVGSAPASSVGWDEKKSDGPYRERR